MPTEHLQTHLGPSGLAPTGRPLPAAIELRQYTLHPGGRAVLVDLFEREFIAPQEACGLQVLGQFEDLDQANRFVWLRGFEALPMRPAALARFYDGPVWQAHRAAANATMIDSHDVLLLRPLTLAGLPALPHRVPTSVPGGPLRRRWLALLCPLVAEQGRITEALAAALRERLLPAGAAAGLVWQALLVTEPAPNNYPRLPVREPESMLVALAGLAPGADGLDTTALLRPLDPWLRAAPQVLRLQPTPGSAWR